MIDGGTDEREMEFQRSLFFSSCAAVLAEVKRIDRDVDQARIVVLL